MKAGGFSLCCFDLDGTLVTTTTVSLHLAEWVGQGELLVDLERRYASGEISNMEVADQHAGLLRGRTVTECWEQLETLPTIKGIAETVGWMRTHSIHPLLATVTWSLAADFFKEAYGFEAVTGCRMSESNGVLQGTIEQHIEAADKVEFVRAFAKERGFGLERCVAIGDSRSDIPLFEAVGMSIALNATPDAQEKATISLDTDDLRDVIPLIDRYG